MARRRQLQLCRATLCKRTERNILMSAPQTNIERQKRRHRGPIAGISAGLAFVVVLVLVYGWQSADTDIAEPASLATQPMVDPAAAPPTAAPQQTAPAN